MTQKILIIDDDTELCDMLSEYLSPEGFSVTSVHSGDRGAERALAENFQALVLDVMLPGLSGFEVLQRIRRSSRIPVIMLTAKGDDIDRILGLEMGADDYLPKPFNPRELVARLRAVLRRGKPDNNRETLEYGAFRLSPAARKAYFQDRELELTSTEFNILEILLSHAGTVVTKEILYQEALGRPLGRYDRSIDMHISHLRRKLYPENTPLSNAIDTEGESPIQTIRGAGYQLVEHGGKQL